MHFLFRPHGLDGVLIELALGLFRHRALGLVPQLQAHQHLAADERQVVLEIRVLRQLLVAGVGRLGNQNDIGHIGDELLTLRLGRSVLQVLADVLCRHGEIALPDVDAVDARDRGIGGRRGRGRILLLGGSLLRAAGGRAAEPTAPPRAWRTSSSADGVPRAAARGQTRIAAQSSRWSLNARSLVLERGKATAGGGSGRRVAQSAPVGNGTIAGDFDENVSRNRQLTRGRPPPMSR